MPIQFHCPGCGKSYSVGEQLAGKQANCKACGTTMSIPQTVAAPSEEDPLEYGIKEDPFAAEPTISPLPPKPRVMSPPPRPSGSNSGRKILWIVLGSIFGSFFLLIFTCCGAVILLPSLKDRPEVQLRSEVSGPIVLDSLFRKNLQAYAYQPIPAPTSSKAIPGSEVRVAFVESHGAGPAGTMQLRIYMPPGEHQPGSLPCVLVGPAGTNLLHGSDMDNDDYHKETLPYAEAGMIVIFYSLDGPEEAEELPLMAKDDKGAIISYKQFCDACAGIINGRNVVDYVLTNIPQANPNKIYAAGHSSAGTVSLLLAAHEPRLAGAVAYAPCSDVEGRLGQIVGVDGIDEIFPDIKRFLHESSPNNNVSQIQCPVFLFHARDDSNVEISESQAFSKQLTQAGVDVTFVTVETGEHYRSMIKDGVPKGVEWIRQKASQR